MTNTYSTIETMILSFEDNWHLPTLSLVNQAHLSGTPSALLSAVKHTDQAITALEHLQTSVALLVEREGSTITLEEACHVANDLEELACSLQYITAELADLAIDIAKNTQYVKLNSYSLIMRNALDMCITIMLLCK